MFKDINFPSAGNGGSNKPVPLQAIAAGFDAAIAAAVSVMGATAPNPPVGCALLDRDGKLLVVEKHPRAGEAHAERRALDAAIAANVYAHVHTAIVTLEPCNHTGRTPPCAQALLQSPVRDVWIGAADPNPRACDGAETLKGGQNGPGVFWAEDAPQLSAQFKQCAALIAPFAKVQHLGESFITVKQALDFDGSMVPPRGQTTFSSETSLTLAHQLRRATDAVITGAGTVLRDNPRLSVRRVPDHPIRKPRILVICDQHSDITPHLRDTYKKRGFDVWSVTELAEIPSRLAAAGVLWAMVEAGPSLLSAIENTGFWDEWLTIRTRHDGPDDVEIRDHGASPTRLLSPAQQSTERDF